MTLKKKELTGRQSHAVHKDKQLIPCSQSTGGEKNAFHRPAPYFVSHSTTFTQVV